MPSRVHEKKRDFNTVLDGGDIPNSITKVSNGRVYYWNKENKRYECRYPINNYTHIMELHGIDYADKLRSIYTEKYKDNRIAYETDYITLPVALKAFKNNTFI